jgi:prepilin signal peptidase PulO-like enzyme (type II secretory pathway)
VPILIAAVGLLGLAVGFFLNAVIYRVPRSESLLRLPLPDLQVASGSPGMTTRSRSSILETT